MKRQLFDKITTMDPPEDKTVVVANKVARRLELSLQIKGNAVCVCFDKKEFPVYSISQLNVVEVQKLINDLNLDPIEFNIGVILQAQDGQFILVISTKRSVMRIIYDLAILSRFCFNRSIVSEQLKANRRYEENEYLRALARKMGTYIPETYRSGVRNSFQKTASEPKQMTQTI